MFIRKNKLMHMLDKDFKLHENVNKHFEDMYDSMIRITKIMSGIIDEQEQIKNQLINIQNDIEQMRVNSNITSENVDALLSKIDDIKYQQSRISDILINCNKM